MEVIKICLLLIAIPSALALLFFACLFFIIAIDWAFTILIFVKTGKIKHDVFDTYDNHVSEFKYRNPDWSSQDRYMYRFEWVEKYLYKRYPKTIDYLSTTI